MIRINPRRLLPNLLILTGVIGMLTPSWWSMRADMLQKREALKPQKSTSVNRNVQQVMPKSKIVIPKMGLDAIVVEEVTESDLDKGPMHLAGTGIPGQPGNCCIAAHKEKWFRKLRLLEIGDPIYIRTNAAKYTYIATDRQILHADKVSVLDPTPKPTITLITCVGPAYFGHGNGRLVVKGVLQPDTKKPATAGN